MESSYNKSNTSKFVEKQIDHFKDLYITAAAGLGTGVAASMFFGKGAYIIPGISLAPGFFVAKSKGASKGEKIEHMAVSTVAYYAGVFVSELM